MAKVNKNLLFALLRLSSLVGTVIWLNILPLNAHILSFNRTAVYYLLVFFAVYSVVLYGCVVAFPAKTAIFYRVVLVPDLIFLSFLVKFTGMTQSAFENAFYLVIALYIYYFQSMRMGVFTAVLAAAFYSIINWGALSGGAGPQLVLQLAFMLVVALCVGFLSVELKVVDAAAVAGAGREKTINQALDNKLAQITVLYGEIQKLAEADSSQQVYEIAVQATSDLLRASVVYLLRPQGKWLKMVIGQGIDPKHLPPEGIRTDAGISGKVFKTQEPILVPDVQGLHDLDVADIHCFQGLGTIALAPVVSERKTLGVLCAGRPQANSYSQEDLDLLAVVAARIGTSLSNLERNESTMRLAFTDNKTDLYNYRYFQLLLEEIIINKSYAKMALLILDIDMFKKVNETYGHQVGDEVLHKVAANIVTLLRDVDVIARFGGEEFVALLPTCALEEALSVSERIRVHLSEHPIKTSAGEIYITVSIGVAEYAEGDSAKGLITKADRAMFIAKEKGRNQVYNANPQRV